MVNGWLILDKPQGITSTRAGTKVKRSLGIKKLGHLGTLDPMATGVLVLALGEATKLLPYITQDAEKTKTYVFTVRWGERTDTGDADGKIIAESSMVPSLEAITRVIPEFIGAQQQVPPSYSAVRIHGQRAYHLARHDVAFTVPSRMIVIRSLTLLASTAEDATFQVECSPGTYIRSLASDLAEKLDALGHVTMLRRIKDGTFSIKNAISLEKFLSLSHKYSVTEVLSIGAVLGDIPAVSVLEEERAALLQGRAIRLMGTPPDEQVVRIMHGAELLGMGHVKDGLCYPKRIINY